MSKKEKTELQNTNPETIEQSMPSEIIPCSFGTGFIKKCLPDQCVTPLVYFEPEYAVPRDELVISSGIAGIDFTTCTLGEFQRSLPNNPKQCIPAVAYYDNTTLPVHNYFNNIYSGLGEMQAYDKALIEENTMSENDTDRDIANKLFTLESQIKERRSVMNVIFANRVKFLARNIVTTFLSEVSADLVNLINEKALFDIDGKSFNREHVYLHIDKESLVDIIAYEFEQKICNICYSDLDNPYHTFGDCQYSIQLAAVQIYDQIDSAICSTWIVNNNPYGQVNHLTVLNKIYIDFANLVQNLQFMAIQLRNECDQYYHEAGYAKKDNIMRNTIKPLTDKYDEIVEKERQEYLAKQEETKTDGVKVTHF